MHNNQIKNNNKTKVIVEHLEKLKNIKTQYK